ncbi:RluA family pseudouridine synthase [Terrihabitans sp. B22-R8]|uniref:RluA family pseudouridine synthase n=1 Tax=Terrihabitans sp. B22-R8 TaxID=3425128 RepID=UPI00403CB80B
MAGVEIVTVKDSEDGLRLDRFLKGRYPALGFGQLQKILRTGQVRVDGARAKAVTKVEAGQNVRIPPLGEAQDPGALEKKKKVASSQDAAFLKSLILFEDRDLIVLNKPHGLAVQGGSGTVRHIDGMLEALAGPDGEKPKLVHRLDRDTAGCLIVAKSRKAASALAKSFRSRSARKIYWALVPGVPNPPQGRISTYLAKGGEQGLEKMRVARHGESESSHAITYYAVVDKAAHRAAWLSLKPVTGRTHQLRAHLEHIGHPILGDPKYGAQLQEFSDDLPAKLMLMARRITLPHPRGGTLDVTAPLPDHFKAAFDVFGFELAGNHDPILEAPED